jgi:hypothetical protein
MGYVSLSAQVFASRHLTQRRNDTLKDVTKKARGHLAAGLVTSR